MTPRRPGYERIAGVDIPVSTKGIHVPAITNPNNGISYQPEINGRGMAHEPNSLRDFQAAGLAQYIADFQKASQEVHDLLVRESELKQAIALRKVDLEVIEARFIAEGKVFGTNAEQRKASLVLLCRDDEDYQVTCADQVVDELEVGRVEAGLELARDARSISKRRVDAWIVIRSLEAASLT